MVFLFLAWVWAPAPDPVAAKPADLSKIKSKIFNLESNIRRLEGKLDETEGEALRITDEVDRLELERALISEKVEKHELELEQSAEQIKATEAAQAELNDQSRVQRRALAERMRQLYKRGNLVYAQLFLRQSRLDELISAYHYAKVLTGRDQRLLAEYRQTQVQLGIVKQALTDIQAEAETARLRLAERRGDLETLLIKRNRHLAAIKREASKQRRMMDDLELEKEEMRLMVRKLTDDDANPFEIQIPISRYKGKLDWPAQGFLFREFGVISDEEFGTKRRQNGINLSLEMGMPVRAVYSGKVIYSDWFKNYGNLLILDHGEQVTSFYAHCDKLLVEKGDFVERNQVIALSGDTGSLEGSQLHFEIREKTKPQDPQSWLRKKGKSTRR